MAKETVKNKLIKSLYEEFQEKQQMQTNLEALIKKNEGLGENNKLKGKKVDALQDKVESLEEDIDMLEDTVKELKGIEDEKDELEERISNNIPKTLNDTMKFQNAMRLIKNLSLSEMEELEKLAQEKFNIKNWKEEWMS
jgi:predicted nuclease with TOPRIM domain